MKARCMICGEDACDYILYDDEHEMWNYLSRPYMPLFICEGDEGWKHIE